MKIRNGFVSNSSSSSFVVIYRIARVEELGNENVYIRGTAGYEGEDYFKPSPEIVEYIRNNPEVVERYNINLYYEYFSCFEDGAIPVEKLQEILSEVENTKARKVKIEAFERDNYSTETLDEFKEKYAEEYED